MDIEFLEKFCLNKGLEISKVLTEEYDSVDFETNCREIEKEIYEVAISYSRILFFEAKIFLQDSVRREVKARLASRFESKKVQKMEDVDLLAHWIKSEAIKYLENKSIFLF